VRRHGTGAPRVFGWVWWPWEDAPVRESRSDFVEALARGLDIITAFSPTATALSVSQVATRTSLPRPTARRLLLTLEQLGYVRSNRGQYTLTTKVLEL
jgi:IclR family pca regulon transcriptional regulator